MDKATVTKNKLIETVIELLKESNEISEITSRKITEKANVNLSTINYHFTSKDELVNIAVNKLIGDTADNSFKEMKESNKEPKEKLRDFLIQICDLVVDYSKYTKEMMPYILLKDDFTQAKEILPLIKECFKESKSDEECRIISFGLMSFMQLAFYRAEELKSFANMNIAEKKDRDRIIDMQLELIIR